MSSFHGCKTSPKQGIFVQSFFLFVLSPLVGDYSKNIQEYLISEEVECIHEPKEEVQLLSTQVLKTAMTET